MKAAPDTGTQFCDVCGRPAERCPVSGAGQPRVDRKRAYAALSVAASQAVRGSVVIGVVLLALFAAAIKVTRHVSAADVVGVTFAAIAVLGGLFYLCPVPRVHERRAPRPADTAGRPPCPSRGGGQ